jgi:hypothetical protein
MWFDTKRGDIWGHRRKLMKYHVTGLPSYGDVGSLSPRNEDRTRTLTIKDIGTTKVVVPDEAKKKLQ